MLYVKAVKVEESPTHVVYRFGDTDELVGRFALERRTGRAELLEPLPSDEDGRLFERAAWKVQRAWQRGEVAAVVVWAS